MRIISSALCLSLFLSCGENNKFITETKEQELRTMVVSKLNNIDTTLSPDTFGQIRTAATAKVNLFVS